MGGLRLGLGLGLGFTNDESWRVNKTDYTQMQFGSTYVLIPLQQNRGLW